MAIITRLPADDPRKWLGDYLTKNVYHWKYDNRNDWSVFRHGLSELTRDDLVPHHPELFATGITSNLYLNGNGFIYLDDINNSGFTDTKINFLHKEFPQGYPGEGNFLANISCAVSLVRPNRCLAGAGLFFKNKTTDSFCFFGIRGDTSLSSGGILSVVEFTAPGDFGAGAVTEAVASFHETPTPAFYLRIERVDRTQTQLYWSTDGIGWNTYETYVASDSLFFDANTLGFGWWLKPTGELAPEQQISVSFDWVAHTESV